MKLSEFVVDRYNLAHLRTAFLVMNLIVMLVFSAVLGVLGWNLYRLTTVTSNNRHQVRTLTARVLLSLLLFVVLYVCWYFGLIEPNTPE